MLAAQLVGEDEAAYVGAVRNEDLQLQGWCPVMSVNLLMICRPALTRVCILHLKYIKM